jgi:Saf-pilin pilus formation protein
MKKCTLSLLTLAMVLSSATAFAEVPLGDSVNASADLVFVSPSTLTHEIVPVTGLVAGNHVNHSPTVAQGKVRTTMGNAASSVVVEWVNGTVHDNYGHRRAFVGVNTGAPLVLELRATSSTSSSTPLEGNGTRIGPMIGAATGTSFDYNIYTGGTALGNNDIKADTYNIVLKAQAYTA